MAVVRLGRAREQGLDLALVRQGGVIGRGLGDTPPGRTTRVMAEARRWERRMHGDEHVQWTPGMTSRIL